MSIFEFHSEHRPRENCHYFAFYLDAIVSHIIRLINQIELALEMKEQRVFHIPANSQEYSKNAQVAKKYEIRSKIGSRVPFP